MIVEAELRRILEESEAARNKFTKLRAVLLADSHYGIGASPTDLVYTENKMRLLRVQRNAAAVRFNPPLLLVPSLINRYYVLDLLPGRSFAGFLAEQGFDVYMIDWGEPTHEDRFNGLAYYMDLLHRCARTAGLAAGAESLHVLGYCMGGMFALLYAALHPERVRNLVLLTAPIDQDVEGGVAGIAARANPPDENVDNPRLIPAREVKSWFEMLAPGSASGPARWMDLWSRLDQDQARLLDVKAMATWMDDNVAVAGRLMGELAQLGPGRNGLMYGTVLVGGTPVDLGRVTMPVYSVSAEQDGTVPCASADAVTRVVPHAEVKRLPGGHVGIVAGKAALALWPAVATWLGERSAELAATG